MGSKRLFSQTLILVSVFSLSQLPLILSAVNDKEGNSFGTVTLPNTVEAHHLTEELQESSKATYITVPVIKAIDKVPSPKTIDSLNNKKLKGYRAKSNKQRLGHAKELLGKYYKKTAVGKKIVGVRPFIVDVARRSLPKKWKKKAPQIADAILKNSKKHKFDPIFLMSVIVNESSFRPDIRGGVGEIGLMQIRPKTAKWISKKMGIRYKGKKSLKNPVKNIEIGAAYIAHLRDRFKSHGRLYLAAYNMGATNVNRALARAIWPKTYAAKVMKYYMEYYKQLTEPAQFVTKN